MSMVLIADSGGTKTDWTLLVSPYPTRWDVVSTFQTQGINPIHQTPDTIRLILSQEMMGHLSSFSRAAIVNTGVLEKPLLSQVEVFFYGSGCTPVHVPMMKQLLSQLFQPEKVEVHSDLQAAARALCQHEPGIACILGTGANSCLYDGNDIVQNTPALGYILGDEGSGSVLGRMFLNAIFKNPALADVRDHYLAEAKLTQADIINKVYREPLANRFLASTSLYISQHLDNPLLKDKPPCFLCSWYHLSIYQPAFGQPIAQRLGRPEFPPVLPCQHYALWTRGLASAFRGKHGPSVSRPACARSRGRGLHSGSCL